MSALSSVTAPERPALRIFATVILNFVGYLTIALPLAVLPTLVASGMGLGAVTAGLTVSTQYIATVLSRAQVGRMSDVYGPKRAVMWGFIGCIASGLLTTGAALTLDTPALALGLMLAGRLALGLAESWISTGVITWSIGQVGPEHTVRIISWNGIATFGALALGAPLGVVLAETFGFLSIGLCTVLLGVLGLTAALAKPAVAVIAEKRLGQRSVVARILPYGCIMALASIGFGAIGAFVTLYFASRDWHGASGALSMFGIGFIGARLLLGQHIQRHGGLRVGLVALSIETLGLALIGLAPVPAVAMLGAGIAGFGFAPVFPAVGVVAVGRVPPQNRGAAIGLYSVFMDVALGATGPLAGLLIERFGAVSPFWLGTAAALLAIGATGLLLAQ